jgi:2-oxoglutarate ferredoxin oxidoreductase subunit alpha
MVEDVRLAVEGKVPIEFYGKMGGAIPAPEEVLDQIKILSSFKTVKGS